MSSSAASMEVVLVSRPAGSKATGLSRGTAWVVVVRIWNATSLSSVVHWTKQTPGESVWKRKW